MKKDEMKAIKEVGDRVWCWGDSNRRARSRTSITAKLLLFIRMKGSVKHILNWFAICHVLAAGIADLSGAFNALITQMEKRGQLESVCLDSF